MHRLTLMVKPPVEALAKKTGDVLGQTVPGQYYQGIRNDLGDFWKQADISLRLAVNSPKVQNLLGHHHVEPVANVTKRVAEDAFPKVKDWADSIGAFSEHAYVLSRPLRDLARNMSLLAVAGPQISLWALDRMGLVRHFEFEGDGSTSNNRDIRFAHRVSPAQMGTTKGSIFGNPDGLHIMRLESFRKPVFLVPETSLLPGQQQAVPGIEIWDKGKIALNTSTVASALLTFMAAWRFGVGPNYSIEVASRNYGLNFFANTDLLGIDHTGNMMSNFYGKLQAATLQWRVRANFALPVPDLPGWFNNLSHGDGSVPFTLLPLTGQYLQELAPLGSMKLGFWGIGEDRFKFQSGLQAREVAGLHFFTAGWNRQFDPKIDNIAAVKNDIRNAMEWLETDGDLLFRPKERQARAEKRELERQHALVAQNKRRDDLARRLREVEEDSKALTSQAEPPIPAPQFKDVVPEQQTIWRYYEQNAPKGLPFSEYERVFRQLNNLGRQEPLQSGASIVVPRSVEPDSTVTVAPGQTAINYYRLSNGNPGDYHAWLERLRQLNPDKVGPNYMIYAGDRLVLPGAVQ